MLHHRHGGAARPHREAKGHVGTSRPGERACRHRIRGVGRARARGRIIGEHGRRPARSGHDDDDSRRSEQHAPPGRREALHVHALLPFRAARGRWGRRHAWSALVQLRPVSYGTSRFYVAASRNSPTGPAAGIGNFPKTRKRFDPRGSHRRWREWRLMWWPVRFSISRCGLRVAVTPLDAGHQRHQGIS